MPASLHGNVRNATPPPLRMTDKEAVREANAIELRSIVKTVLDATFNGISLKRQKLRYNRYSDRP